MTNHAQITVFAKPQVRKSRGFGPQSNHGSNHANHAADKTAGQEITLKSRVITRGLITNPTVPLGTGVRSPDVATPLQEMRFTDDQTH